MHLSLLKTFSPGLLVNLTNCIFALIDLKGKNFPTHMTSLYVITTLRLLDLFPGYVYSCLCDRLDVIFFLKQPSAIKRSVMMIRGAAQIDINPVSKSHHRANLTRDRGSRQALPWGVHCARTPQG